MKRIFVVAAASIGVTVLLIVMLVLNAEKLAEAAVNAYFLNRQLPLRLSVAELSRDNVHLSQITVGKETRITDVLLRWNGGIAKRIPDFVSMKVQRIDAADFAAFEEGDSETHAGENSIGFSEICRSFSEIAAEIEVKEIANEGSVILLNVNAKKPVHESKIDFNLTVQKPLESVIGTVAFECEKPQSESVSFRVSLATEKVKGKVDANGTFNSHSGEVAADWNLKSLPLAGLVPFVEKFVKSLSGSVHGSGEFKMQGKDINLAAKITGKSVNVETDAFQVQNVNFKNLALRYPPLKVARGTKMTVDAIHAGPSIQGVETEFEADSLDLLRVLSLKGSAEGAKFEFKRFEVSPEPISFSPVELKVTDWPLEKFLRLLYSDGATGTGRLQGALKVSQADKSLVIENGELKSDGPGVLMVRHPGSTPPNNRSIPSDPKAILDGYLYNFHYDNLDLLFSSDKDYRMKLTLRAFGRNPDYLNRKPLKLSVNFDLNIRDAVRSIMLTYDLPDRIKQRLYEGN